MTSKVSRRVHHLVGFPDELGGGHDEFVDPNEDYVASLTEGERQAFNEALRGESVDGAAPDTGSLTAESGGCDGGPLNEQYRLGDIRAEYERQFLDEKAEAVAQYAAN